MSNTTESQNTYTHGVNKCINFLISHILKTAGDKYKPKRQKLQTLYVSAAPQHTFEFAVPYAFMRKRTIPT